MIKPTKRKAFNFLRSYFDVFNELKTDADKLDFLTSIINKQFLDEDPKELNFIVNLCYESQRHQIESSVKGWERASNDTLSTTPPTTPPTTKQEEEEEVKEKEKEKEKNIKQEIINSTSWLESIAMQKKIDGIDKLLKKFLDEQELLLGEGNGFNRNINDIKNHFSNWVSKQKPEKKKVVYNAQNF